MQIYLGLGLTHLIEHTHRMLLLSKFKDAAATLIVKKTILHGSQAYL
jgi:hypothetical protein